MSQKATKLTEINKTPFFTAIEREVYIKEYLLTKKASTAELYGKTLNRFVKKYGRFTFLNIAKWHEDTQNNHSVSNSYARTNYNIIKNFFTFLTEIKVMESNPVLLFKPRSKDYSTRHHKPLHPLDIALLLTRKRNENTYIDFIRFQLLSGCRSEELLNLKHHKFSRNSKTLIITGKGHRKRTLLLSRELFTLYNRIMKHSENVLIDNPNDRKECNAKYKAYQRGLLKIIKRRNTRPFSSHSLRATYATNLYDKGYPIEQISMVLGHASINMTKTYIDSLRSDKKIPMPTSTELYNT